MKGNILQEGIIMIILAAIVLVLVVATLAILINVKSTYAFYSELAAALQSSCYSSQYFSNLNFENKSVVVFQAYVDDSSLKSCLATWLNSYKYYKEYVFCYGYSSSLSLSKGIYFSSITNLDSFCSSLPSNLNVTCFPITCKGINSYVSNGAGQAFIYIYDTNINFVDILANSSHNYLMILPPQRG